MYFGGGRSILGVGKCWTYRSLGTGRLLDGNFGGQGHSSRGYFAQKQKRLLSFEIYKKNDKDPHFNMEADISAKTIRERE